MIEELKIIQEIFGDLTGLGVWGIVAWFSYNILCGMAWLYGILKVLDLVKWCFLTGERKDAASSEAAIDRDRYRREAEEVKHMYKLLKEAKESKDV